MAWAELALPWEDSATQWMVSPVTLDWAGMADPLGAVARFQV
jgi:hypothetical protein